MSALYKKGDGFQMAFHSSLVVRAGQGTRSHRENCTQEGGAGMMDDKVVIRRGVSESAPCTRPRAKGLPVYHPHMAHISPLAIQGLNSDPVLPAWAGFLKSGG